MKRFSMRVFVFAVACLASLSMCRADELAAVTGLVTDPNGRSVPGVNILITNLATNVTSRTATNDQGIYRVPSLQPGIYRMTIDKDGFKSIVKSGVELHVQDVASINFELQIGSVNETVTVESGGLVINTSDASVSTVVDQTYIKNMPLNGRSFQDLILLSPGVVTNNPQTLAGTSGKGEFSVSGQRTESNYYTVDGVSANVGIVPGSATTAATSGSLPAATALGTTQNLLSVDALQEFRVQTSTYSAEYGRNPGGQFSFVTRSGTNQWHGTAFDYLRNDAFDANDWFNDYFGRPSAPLRQNDFGGTLGGPIRIPHLYNGKDKTFFFFSYEGLRLLQPQAASVAFVPSVSLRTNTPAPLQQVLNAFPVPNGTDLGNGLAQFVNNWSNPSSIDSTSIRLDQAVKERLRLFFRFSNTSSFAKARNTGAPSEQISTPSNSRTYTFGATSSLSSRLSNDLRLNYSSSEVSSVSTLDNFGGATPANLFALQGLSAGNPTASVGVFFLIGGQFTGINQFNTIGKQKQWNIVDTLSFSLGEHQLKFGGDYRRLTPNIAPLSPGLNYRYFSASSVQSNSVGLGIAQTNATADPIYTNFSGFGQDDWRITPRLNLSVGVRWEVNPPPGAPTGNLPYTVQGSTLSTLTLAPQGTPLWKTTWYNVAPRLGLAYVLGNKAGWETVIRGGGGVFFDTGQQLGSTGYLGPGFRALKLFGGLVGSPASFPAPPAQANPPIVNPPTAPYPVVLAFYPHLQLPFTLQWNGSIQQALGRSQSLTVSFVGANGRRLLQQQEPDISSVNSNFPQGLILTSNGLTSDYSALQVQFQRRVAHGLEALASYTWSHSIDYGSQNSELPYLRGNSDFDVRHSFSSGVSYDLPTPFHNGFARALLHNWGLDDRFTARTGFPVTLNGTDMVNPATGELFHAGLNLVPGQPIYIYGSNCASVYGQKNSAGQLLGCPGGWAINPDAFCDPSAGPCSGGNAPRNFVRGFPVWQMDLAVRRDFPIRERLRLQFRAEAFNVFNHPNFGTINGGSFAFGSYCTPDIPASPSFSPGCTFGQAKTTLAQGLGGLNALYQMGGPRSMQFALKLVF